MVSPSPLGWDSIPARRRQPWRWGVAAVAVLVVGFVLLHVITVSYYAIYPGDALPVNGPTGTVTVDGQKPGPPHILLATVLEQDHVTEWDRLTNSWLHPDVTLYKTVDIRGGLTPQQYDQANHDAMIASQEYAEVAALRRMGYPVPEHGAGVEIGGVEPGTPAAAVLKAHDVITAVNGTPVNLASELITGLDRMPAGAVVRLTVRRGTGAQATTLTPALKAIACGPTICPDNPNRAFLGVADPITYDLKFSFPPNVHLDINTTDIGGPSAGLAFTLGAIQALVGHDITAGRLVAATGTIDPNGAVGEVGGVKQKTIAVAAHHSDYFLVPSSEAKQARSAAAGRHVTIVPVDTLEQALQFLRSIGGDLGAVPATPSVTAPEYYPQ